jgi:C4-dicarboxylate transporter DctM subunit
MIFASVSGSGAATIAAIGGITAPEMRKRGYGKGFTAAMSAGAGSLGPIIPPSVDMIVFGCITGMSIARMFIGGIIPGVIIGLLLMSYCYIYAKKHDIDYGGKFRASVVWQSFKHSIWALLMPIIIIGGVMGGIFTATEAGGVACVYGLFVAAFVYKTLNLKTLIEVLKTSTVNMAMVMMIIGMSTLFSYILALENVGPKIVDWMLSITENPTGLFFLVIGIMVVIGCFMESLAALPIILPIIYPMFAEMGVNLNQLGVVFALSTVLGGLTPPVGIYLFLSMNMNKAKMKETVLPHMLIVIGIMLAVIVLCILLPIPQFLPELIMGPM